MLDEPESKPMKICHRCDNMFLPKHKSIGKYCSVECHNKYQQEHKINNREWITSRYTPKTFLCKTCEKPFDATRGMKYCSIECRTEMGTRKKCIDRKPQTFNCICIHCDKHFIHHNLSTFCTKECKKEYKKIHAKKDIGKGTCTQCGLIFNKRFNNAAQHFCTRNCYWEYRRQHPEEKIQTNQTGAIKIDKICISCGSIFSVHPYRKDAEFCSRVCHYNHKRNMKICKKCKIEFYTPKHIDADYCGTDCASKGSDIRKSKLARAISGILDTNNIEYETEAPIKSIERTVWTDFMIDNKIVIEANGDYWHCNPIIYAPTYYHTQVQKTAEQIWKYDADRKKYIESNGYICIFIWESELFDPNLSDRLVSLLKEIICNLQK